jgi:hypothetical protein
VLQHLVISDVRAARPLLANPPVNESPWTDMRLATLATPIEWSGTRNFGIADEHAFAEKN